MKKQTSRLAFNWTFFGRLLPERAPVFFQLPEVKLKFEAFGATLTVRASIHASQIVVSVKTAGKVIDIHTLRNLVESHVRSVVDLIGYDHGMRLDVELISCASPDGTWHVFGVDIPALGRTPDTFKAGEYSMEQLTAVMNNAHLAGALADFREAIRLPAQTGFFCYRVADAARAYMAELDDKNGRDWERMRTNLQIDRSAIDRIKPYADRARHGDVGAITDVQRAEVFKIADEVIRRFRDYVLGGNEPLDVQAYPLLKIDGPDPAFS